MTSLTDLAIRKLPVPETGQKTHWEKGFGVRVSQGGSKTFVAKVDGKLHTIGRYPDITLKEARREALRLKLNRPSRETETTLKSARDAFLEDCVARLRPSTVAQYRFYLNLVDVNLLSAVTRFDIGNSPHCISSWKVFMNWCIKHEFLEKNPFAFMETVYGERTRFLTNAELKLVFNYDHPPYSDYIKLCILTGQRIGQWQQYEVRDDTIVFPREVMKGKKEHTIPLLPMTAALLPVAPFNGWSKGKKRMDEKTGVTDYRVHDLRRTFSTTMASLQVPLHVTEAILDHRSGTISGVAATYNRYNYLIEMREALDRLEKHIQAVTA